MSTAYTQVPTPQWNGARPNGLPGGIKLSCCESLPEGAVWRAIQAMMQLRHTVPSVCFCGVAPTPA